MQPNTEDSHRGGMWPGHSQRWREKSVYKASDLLGDRCSRQYSLTTRVIPLG